MTTASHWHASRLAALLFALVTVAASSTWATDPEELFQSQADFSGTYKIVQALSADSSTYTGTVTFEQLKVVKTPRGSTIIFY